MHWFAWIHISIQNSDESKPYKETTNRTARFIPEVAVVRMLPEFVEPRIASVGRRVKPPEVVVEATKRRRLQLYRERSLGSAFVPQHRDVLLPPSVAGDPHELAVGVERLRRQQELPGVFDSQEQDNDSCRWLPLSGQWFTRFNKILPYVATFCIFNGFSRI